MKPHLKPRERQASVRASDAPVPSSAGWLGGLGAAPFIGLAAATPFLTGPPRLLVAHALLAYGATILSFLGGAHWGLTIGSETGRDDGRLRARLVLSVVPSLVAWAALLLPGATGLFVLALAISAMLFVDIRAARAGDAPPWYPKLRVPLTCVVVGAILFGALA